MTFVVGIAGGSGSGKTTIAEALLAELGDDRAVLIQHDAYYRHRGDLSFEERTAINYDHPDSLETERLVEDLAWLKEGRGFDQPVYDFVVHLRAAETVAIEPRAVVILEGILVLADAALRDQIDLSVFVDTEPDVRFARRLRRDIEERGRSADSVLKQYFATVRPMHLEFIQPSKRYADLVIPEGYETTTFEILVDRVSSHL